MTLLPCAEWSPALRLAWLAESFEFEDCEECGQGAAGHECVPGPFGLPFARCRDSSKSPAVDPSTKGT